MRLRGEHCEADKSRSNARLKDHEAVGLFTSPTTLARSTTTVALGTLKLAQGQSSLMRNLTPALRQRLSEPVRTCPNPLSRPQTIESIGRPDRPDLSALIRARETEGGDSHVCTYTDRCGRSGRSGHRCFVTNFSVRTSSKGSGQVRTVFHGIAR